MQPVRVAVARGIEPVPRHVFTVARRLQQAVHDALVGVGILVREQRLDLGERRRQPGQVKGHAPQQRFLGGLGRRRQAVRVELRQNERVNRRPHHGPGLHRRHRGTLRRFKGPMPLVVRALFEPLLEHRHLPRRELLVRLGRRHDVVGIRRRDAPPQRALRHLPRHHRAQPFAQVRARAVLGIQTQLRLALLLIRPVAREAVVRQNRPHVVVEIHLLRHRRSGARPRARQHRHAQPNRHDPVSSHNSKIAAANGRRPRDAEFITLPERSRRGAEAVPQCRCTLQHHHGEIVTPRPGTRGLERV